jgi:hydroxyacylglutathione hydrolase
MIIEVISSGPVETNAFLLGCPISKQGAIVDAPFESTQLLLDLAHKHGLKINMLLFTHSHWDHIADAYLLQAATHAPIYIHSEDAGNLQDPGSDHVPCPFPIVGIDADHLIKDGDMLRLGQLDVLVIHTPGHTPGGCCFYIKQEKALFSGDTLFKGTIGRLNLATGRQKMMAGSLRKLAELPPSTRVYPGHGEATTIQSEHWLATAEKRFQL